MTTLSDDTIRALYAKVTSTPLEADNLLKARHFINVVFEHLEPSAFIDTTGEIVSEAWACEGNNPEPLFKRPIV